LFYDKKGNKNFYEKNSSFLKKDISINLISEMQYLANTNFSLECNADSDNLLSNVTLFIWDNSCNNIYSRTIASSYSAIFDNISLNQGIYSWNCLWNSNNLSEFAYQNSSIEIVNAIVSLNSSQDNLSLSCSIQPISNSYNVSFSIWNNTFFYQNNISLDSNNIPFLNISFLNLKGTYSWNCEFNNDFERLHSIKNSSFSIIPIMVHDEPQQPRRSSSKHSSPSHANIVNNSENNNANQANNSMNTTGNIPVIALSQETQELVQEPSQIQENAQPSITGAVVGPIGIVAKYALIAISFITAVLGLRFLISLRRREQKKLK